jgi:predicted alpha/beta hydrolase
MVAATLLVPRTETISFQAADGFALVADLTAPAEPRAVVLLAPAMGVPRTFYRSFGAFLAENELAVLALDYRGIGGSKPKTLRGFEATLHGWAELDLEAALAWIAEKYPRLPILWVGHSVGGQLFGLLREPPVTAAIFVASQSGYYKNWDGAARLGMQTLWNVLIPGFTAVTGKLPMKLLGQGEDVPAGVAREWAEWGKNPEYILSYAKLRPGRAFETWTGKLRSYAISDDGFAPPRSVEALLTFYEKAQTELRPLFPADLGMPEIKHFGPFRKKFRETLWMELRDYLLSALK